LTPGHKHLKPMQVMMIRSFRLLSDEDANFPASELNNHGPTVHGWRSAPDASLTSHDIILRFQQPAKIYRIQLLAHQYLIRKLIYFQSQLNKSK